MYVLFLVWNISLGYSVYNTVDIASKINCETEKVAFTEENKLTLRNQTYQCVALKEVIDARFKNPNAFK